MATELAFGSVPAFYREVYEILCPSNEHVDQDMFIKLLVKVWEVCCGHGHLSRNGLYKSLAMIALAQQGKIINDKVLESFSGQELPRPLLGDLSDLKSWSIKVRRERNPTVLGYTYTELRQLDTIRVEVVPERKGLILKHIEYEVSSQRHKSTVLRRYNDFVAFHEVLLQKFPYRMVPLLPPKKMVGANREFIEQRRRALRRFISLVARHPKMNDESALVYFLTFTGNDLQYKIRETYRGAPDEFMTSDVALKSKEIVPLDTQTQFSNSKTVMASLIASLLKSKEVAERLVMRGTAYANDMLLLGKELGALATETTPVTAWACGNCDSWTLLKKGFKSVSCEYAALADKASSRACEEDETVVEELSMLLDLLLSYKDLCDRHEKGVLSDHQKALAKLGQYKKKKMSATVSTSETNAVEQLEQRILEQESEISNMENRNYFSLHCVQMETQLVHANLRSLYAALCLMAEEESKLHGELGDVWRAILPVISAILPPDPATNGSDASRGTSPMQSPVMTHNAR